MNEEAFERTWLYHKAFIEPRSDCDEREQRFFRDSFLAMRKRVIPLVAQIQRDMPDYTVHDITHLDALWETGSLLFSNGGDITPAEAFVFGGAVLLHDAGMTLSAYPGGLPQIKQTIEWQDTAAQFTNGQPKIPEQELTRKALPIVLRRLHAKAAPMLAANPWRDEHGTEQYLIENSELRSFYGPTIGLTAYSHWWPIHKVGEQLSKVLGAFPNDGSSVVNRLKVACLLRLSDALHIDRRRAPPFLRTLLKPEGTSADHWTAQGKIAKPRLDGNEVVFSSASAFPRSEASSWWLLFDLVSGIDRELRGVDALLQEYAQPRFSAAQARGASSPQSLAAIIETEGWKPVDTQLRVSDVPKVIEVLGGTKLYGENPTVALRELLQNSSDAISARRKLENRPSDWGQVTVTLWERENHWHLTVEDNGVGMSEHVLTGPLLDFGKSFWKSDLVTEEFPGLMKAGMQATGQFGIGFFSSFMLGSHIKVTSRKYDCARDSAKTLEFVYGTTERPLLYPAQAAPIDGGTRVEITLNKAPHEKGGLLYRDEIYPPQSLAELLGVLAPASSVTLIANEGGEKEIVVEANDWLTIDDEKLLARITSKKSIGLLSDPPKLILLRSSDGEIYGRARISGYQYGADGCITAGGLRAAGAYNIDGILVGSVLTAARDHAVPTIPPEILSNWATSQALDIANRAISTERKANCAEVVLECRGNPSDLPIARLGTRWQSINGLAKMVAKRSKIVVHHGDDPSFDEDRDDVRPSDFEENLVLKNSILFVPKHFGGLSFVPTTSTGREYPDPTGNLSTLVYAIMKKVWGDVSRQVTIGVIGDVLGTDISRTVVVYRKKASR